MGIFRFFFSTTLLKTSRSKNAIFFGKHPHKFDHNELLLIAKFTGLNQLAQRLITRKNSFFVWFGLAECITMNTKRLVVPFKYTRLFVFVFFLLNWYYKKLLIFNKKFSIITFFYGFWLFQWYFTKIKTFFFFKQLQSFGSNCNRLCTVFESWNIDLTYFMKGLKMFINNTFDKNIRFLRIKFPKLVINNTFKIKKIFLLNGKCPEHKNIWKNKNKLSVN